MPQIAQIAATYASQFFWLFLTFGLIYVVVGRGMLPKISATIDARDARIAEDLAAAEDARRSADAAEEANRVSADAGRVEAARVAAAAKAASARTTETRVAEADLGIAGRTQEAERRLATARTSALSEVEGVAAAAAQELVAKLSGVTVGRSEAGRAVRLALAAADLRAGDARLGGGRG